MFASFYITLRQTHPVDWFMTSSPRLVFVHWPLQYVKLSWAEFGVEQDMPADVEDFGQVPIC